MKPVRVRSAIIAGAATTVVLGVLLQLMVNRGSPLPKHSWWEAALLLLLGAALVASGWRIHRYVAALGEARDPESGEEAGAIRTRAQGLTASDIPSPESARRTLVLAQAAALGGAVLTGWYLAQIGVHLPRWNVTSVQNALILLGVLAVEGTALSVVGFRVQKWCTLPEDQR